MPAYEVPNTYTACIFLLSVWDCTVFALLAGVLARRPHLNFEEALIGEGGPREQVHQQTARRRRTAKDKCHQHRRLVPACSAAIVGHATRYMCNSADSALVLGRLLKTNLGLQHKHEPFWMLKTAQQRDKITMNSQSEANTASDLTNELKARRGT